MDVTTPTGGGGGRLLGGRYQLQGIVGQGGMADVELARDQLLDREVAVKILHARYATDAQFQERFRREAQAAASLNHPNVVAVYDTGSDDGRPYIVMEYVRGQSLRDLLRAERLAPLQAAEIVSAAALGLDYAHERGLVHRDIKPGNILVSDEGAVKVADFGIARAVDAESVTQTAAIFGTAAYVAPEQAQGRPVDRRTDVYALGCVLYELLAGRQPFAADSAVGLAYKHVSEVPLPPSRVNPQISAQLDAITMRCMGKDPGERYQSARELAEDLQRALQGLPVTALAAGAYATTQFVRREADPTMVVPRAVPVGTGPIPVAVPVAEPVLEERVVREEPPPRGSNRAVVAILLFLLVLGLIGLGAYLFTRPGRDPGVVPTPSASPTAVALVDVVGADVATAEQTLRDAGLEPIRGEARPDPAAPPGQVLEQTPPAGTPVTPGTQVTLITSGGLPVVDVPDVTGQAPDAATAALTAAGLTIAQTQEQPSDDVEGGLVVGTNPPAGTRLEQGQAVTLLVSSGRAPLTLPSVRNFDVADAVEELEGFCGEAPCVEVLTSEEFSDSFVADAVISQDPEGGTEVERGTQVRLVVSLGPEPEPTPTPTPTPTEVPTTQQPTAQPTQTATQAPTQTPTAVPSETATEPNPSETAILTPGPTAPGT